MIFTYLSSRILFLETYFKNHNTERKGTEKKLHIKMRYLRGHVKRVYKKLSLP